MGGRGGAGITPSNAPLPGRLSFDPNKTSYPELVGSPKQIKWAEKIREQLMEQLISYTMNRASDGSVSGMADIYLAGEAAMRKDLKSSPLLSSLSPEVRVEKINRSAAAFWDAKNRLERLHKIAQNKDAKFWINNRTDQPENYLNKKLKKFIDGK